MYTLATTTKGLIGIAIENNQSIRVIEKLTKYINPSEYNNEALVLSVLNQRIDIFKLLLSFPDVHSKFKKTSVVYHVTDSETQIVENLLKLIIKLNRYGFAKVLFDDYEDILNLSCSEYEELFESCVCNTKPDTFLLLLDKNTHTLNPKISHKVLEWFISYNQFMCKDNIRPQLHKLLKQINNNTNE